MTKEVLNIGSIREVTGSEVIAELDTSDTSLYRTYKSRKYAVGQVGSIIKIVVGDGYVFGTVSALRMTRLDEVQPDGTPQTHSTKLLSINLFGEGQRTGLGETDFRFVRGVTNYPLPGHSVYLTTGDELAVIYSPPDEASIEIGRVAQVGNLPVHVKVDDLLGKHFAILGTTGSGKSCATACLLSKLVKTYPGAHTILVDPHAEYFPSFKDFSENLDVSSLQLPHWTLNFSESIGLFIGKVEHVATSQSNILKDAILRARAKWAEENNGPQPKTVDSPTPYKIGDLLQILRSETPSTPKTEKDRYEKIINKIRLLQDDVRYSFLINDDDDVKDNLTGVISQIIRVPVSGKPVSILDLSGVPSEIVDVIVSLLFRTVFDFALWAPRPIQSPLLIVCEEAHRYVPQKDDVSFQDAREAIGRIAKEGRKYGVGLGLVSQRPAELDETILSQCNTIISLRMSNEKDQSFVRRALPDSTRHFVDVLPALKTGEAIVVGEGISVPARVIFERIPQDMQPRSMSVEFSALWSTDNLDETYVREIVGRWREGRRD